MNKKNILLILGGMAVVVIYFYLYRDSFTKKPIPVYATMRPRIGRRGPAPAANNQTPPEMMVFGLGSDYKLTEIQVVTLSDALTNKYPHAIWHLISESNSVPTADFAYGMGIRGMHPANKGARPEPLLPLTGYRILVQAGKAKGAHDFTTPAEEGPAQ
ncbi:MAG: hypothetical protein JWR19_4127 [Pedosphaera sp.]|nr:hypothetical protein [Pedosphaera sp.]